MAHVFKSISDDPPDGPGDLWWNPDLAVPPKHKYVLEGFGRELRGIYFDGTDWRSEVDSGLITSPFYWRRLPQVPNANNVGKPEDLVSE